jgi:hypothetical protein
MKVQIRPEADQTRKAADLGWQCAIEKVIRVIQYLQE